MTNRDWANVWRKKEYLDSWAYAVQPLQCGKNWYNGFDMGNIFCSETDNQNEGSKNMEKKVKVNYDFEREDGDIVRLKSGGPKMTVTKLSAIGATCIWFGENGSHEKEHTFSFGALEVFTTVGWLPYVTE